ncbi:MAG: hypothetical protein V1809_10385 [Planctomycetota bacterium]
MTSLVAFLIDWWFCLALASGLFWGIRGVVLFESNRGWWWKSYQFIFNIVGSFAGWCCLYVLLTRTQHAMPECRGFSMGDVFLFVISMLGLTGHLPMVIWGIVDGFSEIEKRAVQKLYQGIGIQKGDDKEQPTVYVITLPRGDFTVKKGASNGN